MDTRKIVYPGAPSRFSAEKWNEILEFIRSQGHIPFNHRGGALFSDFEGKIGRTETLSFLIDIMGCCQSLWIFGCAEGVMGEWRSMLDLMDISNRFSIRLFPEFDPEWDKYYEKFCAVPAYRDLAKRLRAKQKLFLLVGSRAIGKTYYFNLLVEHFRGALAQVKTNTSRAPREKGDHKSYNFLSKEEFELGVSKGDIFEFDTYHGNYYGASVSEAHKVFDRGQNGILAVTPAGTPKFFERRNELNLSSIICLRPESDRVIEINLDRRKIFDPEERKKCVEESRDFTPPDGVPFKEVRISGNTEIDMPRLLEAIGL